MRFLSIVVAVATPALASATAKNDRVWDVYEAELAKQCGPKHLERLAPAELRDALDDYQRTAPMPLTRQMSRAEKHECRAAVAGATCSNLGDIEIAEQDDLIRQVTAKICGEYARCREQSDCDRAGVD